MTFKNRPTMAVHNLKMPRVVDDESDDSNDNINELENVADEDVDYGGMNVADLTPDQVPGSQPLPRPKQEHFVQLVFQGNYQNKAYQIAFSSQGNQKTLSGNAKDLMRKQHVIDRLGFLRGKLESMTFPTERKDAIAFCAGIMRGQNKPTILRLQALDRLAKMLHWFDAPPASTIDKRPDPAWFADYVKKAKLSHGLTINDTSTPQKKPPQKTAQ